MKSLVLDAATQDYDHEPVRLFFMMYSAALLQLPYVADLLNLGFPLFFELFNFFRILSGQVLRFGAVFFQVIKLLR